MTVQNAVTREDVEKAIQELKDGWEALKTKARAFSLYVDYYSRKDGIQLQVLKENLEALASLFNTEYEKATYYNKYACETYIERFFYLHNTRLFSIRREELEDEQDTNQEPTVDIPNDEQEKELLRTEIIEAIQKIQEATKYFFEQTNCLSVYVSQVHNLELRVHMLSEDLHKLAAQINADIKMDEYGEREYFYIKDVRFFAVPGVTQK